MKKCLLSFFLIAMFGVCVAQPLNGTYTIDASTPTGGTNFQTFSAAFAALTSGTGGVSGPVTINVIEGTYTEQVYLATGSSIPGSSTTNTVTIQSDAGNTNMPIWQYSSYPLYWYYANMSNITIKGLNIKTTGSSRVLYMYYGDYENVSFEDNVLDGYNISSSSNSYAIVYSYYGSRSNLRFTNNTFNEGSQSIYHYYAQGDSVVIEGNRFVSPAYYGLYYNTSTSATYSCAAKVRGNDVQMDEGYTTVYGLYVRYPKPGSECIGNNINVLGGSGSTTYGIYWYYGNYGATTERSLVANNMVVTNDLSNSGTHYSMYVYNTKNTDVWHNSVICNSSSTNARAIYYYCSQSSTAYNNNTLYNNIFTCSNASAYTGYVYQPYNFDGAGNNLFWNGSGMYTYWYTTGTGTSTSYTLQDFEAQSLTTGNLSEEVGFLSPTDLHVFNPNIDGAGDNVGLLYDIDDEVRVASMPDIGADEFLVPDNDAKADAMVGPLNPLCSSTGKDVIVSIQNTGLFDLTAVDIEWTLNGVAQTSLAWTGLLPSGAKDTVTVATAVTIADGDEIVAWTAMPNGVPDILFQDDTVSEGFYEGLSGVYTIGASGGADYADFTAAVADLDLRGVCDTVYMEAEDGVYNEQIVLTEVVGMSATSPVIFRSQNMDTSLVTLTYQSIDQSDNYVVKFDGGDHFTFEHLTIHNTYTSSYSAVIVLSGGADYNTIQDCHLLNNYSSTSNFGSIILSDGGLDEYNVIQNNWIENGSYGLYHYGNSTSSLERGTVVHGNSFRNQYYYGMRLYYQDAPKVTDNSVTSDATYTNGYGIYVGYSDNALLVEGNHVYSQPGSVWPLYGMYIYYCDGNGTEPGAVKNNIISLSNDASGSTYYGMYLYYSYYQRYSNNTSIIRNGSTSSTAMYVYGNYYNELYNNVAVNYGSGYAAYFNAGSTPDAVDYNAYYSNGSLAYWYGAVPNDLAALQTASGMDMNSVAVDPVFSDTTWAAHCSEALDGAASLYPGITDDFHDIMRDPSTPDMGAVEVLTGGSLELGPDTTVCGDEYTITCYAAGTYLWVGGNTLGQGNSYTINALNVPHEFNPVGVSYSPLNGGSVCGALSDNIGITLVPNADLDESLHLCAGESTSLQSATGAVTGSYLWIPTNQTTQSITVDEPGIHKLVKTELGCVSEDMITVTQSDEVDIDDQIDVCEDDLPLAIDATIQDGVTYTWTGGTSTSTAMNTFNDAGEYNVEVEDAHGCVSSNDFEVIVTDVPAPQITEVHGGYTYNFNAGSGTEVGANATYQWVFSDEPNTIYTGQTVTHSFPFNTGATAYSVTLVIVNDCGTGSATKQFIVDPLGVESVNGGKNVLIYPNPASGTFTLNISSASNADQVQVTDLTGRVVMELSGQLGNTVNVEADALTAGTYLVRTVFADGQADVQPIIIK